MARTGDWIPVEKQHPRIIENYPGSGTGKSKPVLVFDPSDPDDPLKVQRCWRGGKGDTTTIHWDWGGHITHWMPLPPPPIP